MIVGKSFVVESVKVHHSGPNFNALGLNVWPV